MGIVVYFRGKAPLLLPTRIVMLFRLFRIVLFGNIHCGSSIVSSQLSAISKSSIVRQQTSVFICVWGATNRAVSIFGKKRNNYPTMATDNHLIVVSSENSPYLAWQTKLFYFSCLSRLKLQPLIIVHDLEDEWCTDFKD